MERLEVLIFLFFSFLSTAFLDTDGISHAFIEKLTAYALRAGSSKSPAGDFLGHTFSAGCGFFFGGPFLRSSWFIVILSTLLLSPGAGGCWSFWIFFSGIIFFFYTIHLSWFCKSSYLDRDLFSPQKSAGKVGLDCIGWGSIYLLLRLSMENRVILSTNDSSIPFNCN